MAYLHYMLCYLMDLIDIVLGKSGDVLRRLRMGGDEHPGFELLYFFQGLKIGCHIIDKSYLIFVQGLSA